jgi:hypothetical protein
VPRHDHESSRRARERAARKLAVSGVIHGNLLNVAEATRIIIVPRGGSGALGRQEAVAVNRAGGASEFGYNRVQLDVRP